MTEERKLSPHRAMRALARDLEGHHDDAEEALAPLKEKYDKLRAEQSRLAQQILEVERQMDEIKGPLHEKRLGLARMKDEHRKAQAGDQEGGARERAGDAPAPGVGGG